MNYLAWWVAVKEPLCALWRYVALIVNKKLIDWWRGRIVGAERIRGRRRAESEDMPWDAEQTGWEVGTSGKHVTGKHMD